MAHTVTAALVVVGNEILSGRTSDANIAYLGRRLNALGVALREVRVVPDERGAIARSVNALRAAHDYVFTTGGIGPTHDDVTAPAVAEAFGVALVRNAEAEARLRAYYAQTGREATAARLRMADMPEGASLIDNPVSSAPGFHIGNVFVLAGVPKIMQAMFEGLRHRLVGGAPLCARTVVVDLAEGIIAAAVGRVQDRHGDVEIGSYPYYSEHGLGVKVVARGTDEGRLDTVAEELKRELTALGGTAIDEEASVSD